MKFQKFQRFLITTLLAIGFFYGGYRLGKSRSVFNIRKDPPKITIVNKSPAGETQDFSLFWQVWDLVNSTYLQRPVDPKKMMLGAIEGLNSEVKQSSESSTNAK